MTTKKSCIYCGSKIPTRAPVCSVCKYHQRRWRNNLLFLAGLGGLLTLVVSALTFTVDRGAQVYRNLFWQDRVNLIDLRWIDRSPHIVLANNGDGPIFVSHIVLLTHRKGRHLHHINKLIAPNEISVVEPKDKERIWEQSPKWVGNESGTPTPGILAEVGELRQEGFGEQFCFTTGFFNENSSSLMMVRQHYREAGIRVVSEPAALHVSFFGSHSRHRMDEEFPIVSAYFMSQEPKCSGKDRL